MKLTHALATFAVLLSATACGDSVPGDPTAGPSTADKPTATAKPTATRPTRSTTTTTAGSGAPVDGATKPGAKLKLGEPARVPISSDSPVLVELTVLTITKGDPADVAGLKLAEVDAGKVPYYVTSRVKNLDGGEHFGAALVGIRGVQPNGVAAGMVITMRDFAKCDTVIAPREFNHAGATFVTCDIALVDPASSVTSVDFNLRPLYEDKPLTWS
ncbi:MAG TPA: hypothetical protein VM677_14590 [Actinokineospora sp.]|jgi:hypothetical protein|nr:hypothetical protein [Actinokineospora sp.]